MNYLNFSIRLFLLLIGYIIASFLAKFIIMLPLADAIQGDIEGVYLSLVITICIAGFCLGAICSKTIKVIPLYGALSLAILATTYKFFRPDFSPLPQAWFLATLAATFTSIMVGAYAAKRKA
ncbi:hypothetical protein PQS90_18990 [Pseudomonas sp. BLCC-B13]|uniref:hypothetical protein n=1 Tax=Pseudomonas sp. BLCC-B13 TaxID=3025314 RepID=UPI00234FA56C|nr:hypothetical protein [Pseudomonas sp. BLCC-B13]MDC7827248.1 hypothetical protein [Pseudomonas sp. BLCC-B13]